MIIGVFEEDFFVQWLEEFINLQTAAAEEELMVDSFKDNQGKMEIIVFIKRVKLVIAATRPTYTITAD